MRARLLGLAACAATALLLPAAALGIGQIDDVHTELADFDVRSESVAPSAEQLALVEGLGAQAFWSRFGTPSSLVKHGGFLASGIEGGTAVAGSTSLTVCVGAPARALPMCVEGCLRRPGRAPLNP